ncbi:hypothetical protein J6590_082590 [Homalodisca vitripennis]|nr:hypothetical protein J6590_082590 [Homalodisca vitripennis]
MSDILSCSAGNIIIPTAGSRLSAKLDEDGGDGGGPGGTCPPALPPRPPPRPRNAVNSASSIDAHLKRTPQQVDGVNSNSRQFHVGTFRLMMLGFQARHQVGQNTTPASAVVINTPARSQRQPRTSASIDLPSHVILVGCLETRDGRLSRYASGRVPNAPTAPEITPTFRRSNVGAATTLTPLPCRPGQDNKHCTSPDPPDPGTLRLSKQGNTATYSQIIALQDTTVKNNTRCEAKTSPTTSDYKIDEMTMGRRALR